MTAKRLLFRSEAREKVLHGAQALADAVRVTLGPKSKSAASVAGTLLLTEATLSEIPPRSDESLGAAW